MSNLDDTNIVANEHTPENVLMISNVPFRTNRTDTWLTINRMCGTNAISEPCDNNFFVHFKCLNSPEEKYYFIEDLESVVESVSKECDSSIKLDNNNSKETIAN